MRWALVSSALTLTLGSCSRWSSCARATAPGHVEPVASRTPLGPEIDEARSGRVLARVNRKRGHGASYVAPEPAELSVYGQWVRDGLRAAELHERPTEAPPSGFELVIDEDDYAFGENDEHRRGAGLLLVRAGRARNLIVEAPHTDFDVGTLDIAVACYEAMNARALLVNTARRTQSGDANLDAEERGDLARSGKALSDVAHAEVSFFSTAHEQTVAELHALTVQLHGFQDDRLPGVRIVLSAAGSNLDVQRFAAALRAVWGESSVACYPADVKRFGGTRNAQAERSRAAGAPFLHVEIARSLRDSLVSDATARTAFARALLSAIEP